MFSKSTWGEQPVEDIPNFPCICVYLFICLCHVSWPIEKRYKPEIWYTYSHRPYLKTCFSDFSKKWPWGPLASKNCRVTWFPAYPLVHIFSSSILFTHRASEIILFPTTWGKSHRKVSQSSQHYQSIFPGYLQMFYLVQLSEIYIAFPQTLSFVI